MAHTSCLLDKQGYMHTPTRPGTRTRAHLPIRSNLCNIYCFSIATIRERFSLLRCTSIACLVVFYIVGWGPVKRPKHVAVMVHHKDDVLLYGSKNVLLEGNKTYFLQNTWLFSRVHQAFFTTWRAFSSEVKRLNCDANFSPVFRA